MKPYIYLRTYPEQDEAALNRLLHSSINRLPYTLACPVEQLASQVEKGNYGRAMNHTLDFFEISVQYLSCILIAILQKEEENTPQKHQALIRAVNKIDTKRPLSFGDWINDIFFPLLKAATEKMPAHLLTISLNKHLISSGGSLLTGSKKESSIVQIRNEYKGHSTTLSEDIYRGVVYTLEPRIFAMLQALSPLQEWSYFSCGEQLGEQEFRIHLLNGYDSQQKTVESPHVLTPSHYYIWQQETKNGEGELIDVFPLIFCNEKNYVYVFQSLKEEYAAYISSNENAVTFIDDCWNEALDKCLQKTVPSFDISKELNWEEIKELTDTASRKFLEHAYKEKKYNRELFVDRKRLSDFFREFRESDKTLFPLLGEAGQGKTNQLCFWTEWLTEHDKSVLIFNSSGFSESTLEEKLKDIFGFNRRKAIQKLLDNIHRIANQTGEDIYFFFDAINECLYYKESGNATEGPLDLYRDIRALLIREEYPRFKVLFTCRNFTWKNLLQLHLPAEDNFTFQAEEEIAVLGFTDEELQEAYETYRELYQMETSFPSLRRSSAIRLKDPLVLKIACTNYLGRELPSSMLSYTSISLFEKMLQDISRSYAGNKQCAIVKELAGYILEEYEKGSPADSISDLLLHQAYTDEGARLHRMSRLIYKQEDISVAYGELLNKPERPILRLVENDNGEGELQFIYERFLEYMLALVFTERERKKLTDPKANIPVETFVNELHQAHTNVVFMGAMRNALIMESTRTRNFDIILRLVRDFGENFEVMLLVSETLNVFIQENYEQEVFALIDQLLLQQLPDGEALIERFNIIDKKLESNQADDAILSEHNRLSRQLAPLIRLRELASVSTVNGIFLTDYFNEGLYQDDPYRLLWALMTDSINDVRNDACMYVYYLSNKTHTLNYSLLKENLTQRIVQEMYRNLKQTPVLKIFAAQRIRKHSFIFLETATRLCTLLIIDAALEESEAGNQQVKMLLEEIKAVFKHFTGNFSLLKVMMPFFQIILRRQLTFQSAYVNNVIEYQTFWDEKIVPLKSNDPNEWSRESFREVLIFIFHYNRYFKNQAENDLNPEQIPDFTEYHNKILSAYRIGDSFSYFALERLLVIMGTCSWDYIRPVVLSFFTEEYRQTTWFDYSQMSMLYILFQVSVNAPEANEEIIALYSRECEEWTRRCKGLYKAHNSHKANPTQYYKRNVMNWYCVVYCRHSGDGVIRPGDGRCVPVFYRLLDEALANRDKELLYHLIENISELVSDFGYIQTALSLLKYIFVQLDSVEKVEAFDQISLERGDIYQDDLVSLTGQVLSTAKNYFPAQVDNFIQKELVGLKYPGVSKYRGDILNYNPSGERLSDLFTHKFGNFLMWALLNEEAVDQFAYKTMSEAVRSPDCFKWFDQVVRHLFMDLFKVKL